VNEVERRLRHLLLAAGFEEGVRGLQMKLDRAIGTTTPDVIDRPPHHPLKAAAGAFGDPQHVDEGNWDWVEVNTSRRLASGMFVAQVVGKSMEPRIPDGAYCLFSSPIAGTRHGRAVLVQLRDGADPETGERYAVKRYESVKAASEDGTWRHVRITLRPENPSFQPIELTADDEASVRVIAEVVEVLG
jgi:phage repressor protein C with HTH and peptisase S24 domain